MSTVTPADRHELATFLAGATRAGATVRVHGAGSGAPRGLPLRADHSLSTLGLDRTIAYEPADMTLTVEGGVPARAVRETLERDGMSWPQATLRENATVGGILASAASGLGRLRWGPVRDSLLEVVICTGDGRLVRAGGRTVKGVAGYDLPRLVVGSLGTLGVIVEATIKLWPRPQAAGWFCCAGDQDALRERAAGIVREAYRPGAVVLGSGELWVHVVGAEADVVAPEGMSSRDHGPSDGDPTALLVAAVSPRDLAGLTRDLDAADADSWAQFGVGICHIPLRSPDDIPRLRSLATSRGGHAQVVGGSHEFREDPWGPPPPGIEVMRRLRDAFDPAHVLNPGCFVGDAPARV